MVNGTGTSLQPVGDSEDATAAQKSVLVAELAEAISNQFNNIMMAVTSYAELEIKKSTSPEKRALEQIAANAGRATTLIQMLLSLSRKHNRSPRVLSVNELLRNSWSLVRHLVGDEIDVVLDLDPTLLDVKADPVDIEQLLFSFAMTSKAAMLEGGQITLSTKLVELDEGLCGLLEGAGPGKYVLMSVSESRRQNGSHLVPSDQDRRLDLTLRASRDVVRELCGLIRITNDPRQGATVEIYLPGHEHQTPSLVRGGSMRVTMPMAGTILLVEDDDSVRLPAAEFLKMEGFKVLQASTGAEAMQVVARSHSPIDVLVTDVVMPVMSGCEVAEALLASQPNLRVLFISGDSDKAGGLASNGKANGPILQKPFRLEVLGARINELLQDKL